MRRYSIGLVPLLVFAVAGLVRPDAEEAAVPRFANITAACNASGNPQVQPPQIDMKRADSIIWREPSGRATSWVITPKDPENWPFAQSSFTGTQALPATTQRPVASALENHTYSYNVDIVCADSTQQHIDPDIVIGPADAGSRPDVTKD